MTTENIQNSLEKLRKKYNITNVYKCRTTHNYEFNGGDVEVLKTEEYASKFNIVTFRSKHSLRELREESDDELIKHTLNYEKKFKNICYFYGDESVDEEFFVDIPYTTSKEELFDEVLHQFIERAKVTILDFILCVDAVHYLRNIVTSDRYNLSDMVGYLKNPLIGQTIIFKDFFETLWKYILKREPPTSYSIVNKKYKTWLYTYCERVYHKYFNDNYEPEKFNDKEIPVEIFWIVEEKTPIRNKSPERVKSPDVMDVKQMLTSQKPQFITGRNIWIKIVSKFIDKNGGSCNVNKLFKQCTVIPSSSTSESSINKCEYLTSIINIIGKEENPVLKEYKRLIGDDIVNSLIIKAFYLSPYTGVEPENPSKPPTIFLIENNLEVETQIYKYVVPEITEYTPYILNSYGVYSCVLENHSELNKLMVDAKKKGDIKNLENSSHMNLLLLEKSFGISLNNFIRTDKDNFNNKIKTIMFQLFWTTWVMNRLKLKHNDLHFDNILIDKLVEPITLYFRLPLENNITVKLTTNLLLRRFDFDKGVARGYKEVDFNISLLNYKEYNFLDNFMMMDFCGAIGGFSNISYLLDENSNKFIKKYYNQFSFVPLYPHIFVNDKEKRKAIDDKSEDLFKEVFSDLLKDDMRSSEITVMDSNEYFDYIIPPEKKIKQFHPKPPLEVKKKILRGDESDQIDTEIKKEIIKYIKENLQDIFLMNVEYDIIEKIDELLGHLMKKKFICKPIIEMFNVRTRGIRMLSIILIILCSNIYYKLTSSKIPEIEDKILSTFGYSNSNILEDIKSIINYIWTIFEGKLPITISEY